MQGLAASVESALGVKAQPNLSLSDADLSADESDSRSPAAKAALEKEMGRKNLHPVARKALEEEHQRAFGNSFSAGLVESAVNGADVPAKVPASKPETKPAGYNQANLSPIVSTGETALHAASGIGHSIIGGWRGLYELARGGSLDDAVKAVHGTDENAISGVYQPQTEGGKLGTEVLESKANPLNWPGLLFKKAGEVAQDLGAGPGTATAIETGGNALMLAAPAFKGRPTAVPSKVVSGEVASLPAKAGGEAMPLESVPKPALKLVSAEPVAKGANATTNAIETKPRVKGPAAVLQEEKAPEFAESVPAAAQGTKLPATEQARRAEVLKRVGVERVRKSAIEGDKQAASDDYQQSKLTNASGEVMKATLEHEKAALTKHAESIVEDTGGTLGTDETARVARGNTILQPLDNLKKYFDTKTKDLYKVADERAKGELADMPKTHEFVGGDQAEFLGTTEGEALLKGVKARMKSLGMTDAEGNPQKVTIAQAEKLKQYLNNQWQPRTGKLIRGLGDAIDEDVLSNAGEDIYAQARAMRRMRAVTLDEPNGIGKLMDASGPEGINRSVPVEKIPDAVAGMPVEQLKHVIKTLENVPKELQPQAQAAIAEIRAHIANKVLDEGAKHAGQWNAKGVSKTLKNNAAKIGIVFTPEQIAKFADLNEAGHILAKDQSYPGAAVQEHNLVQRGAMAAIRSGSAATGAAIGGPIGAAVGDFLGSGAAKKLGEGASLRATQKRVVKLSDFPK